MTGASAQAESSALRCDRIFKPVIASGAGGERVYGVITVKAQLVGGRIGDVQLTEGPQELLQAARETLLQYRCERSEAAPRSLSVTLEFLAPAPPPPQDLGAAIRALAMAKPASAPPPLPTTRGIPRSNASMRRIFPLRTDALLDEHALAGKPFQQMRVVEDVKPVLGPEHLRFGGRWTVRLTYLINADGSASDFIIQSAAPEVFRRAAIEAMRQSTYAPAAFGDQPVASMVERVFIFNIDEPDPPTAASAASAAAATSTSAMSQKVPSSTIR